MLTSYKLNNRETLRKNRIILRGEIRQAFLLDLRKRMPGEREEHPQKPL